MKCAHPTARELRALVFWCEDCGAVTLATSETPAEGEWIEAKRPRGLEKLAEAFASAIQQDDAPMHVSDAIDEQLRARRVELDPRHLPFGHPLMPSGLELLQRIERLESAMSDVLDFAHPRPRT
jgi:hypothetical protein